jgi:hypothetical protein
MSILFHVVSLLGPHELATPQSRNKRYERTKSSKGENIQFNAAHALLELQVAEIDNEETLLDVEKSDQSHCTFKWMTALSNEIEPESDILSKNSLMYE